MLYETVGGGGVIIKFHEVKEQAKQEAFSRAERYQKRVSQGLPQ